MLKTPVYLSLFPFFLSKPGTRKNKVNPHLKFNYFCWNQSTCCTQTWYFLITQSQRPFDGLQKSGETIDWIVDQLNDCKVTSDNLKNNKIIDFIYCHLSKVIHTPTSKFNSNSTFHQSVAVSQKLEEKNYYFV